MSEHDEKCQDEMADLSHYKAANPRYDSFFATKHLESDLKGRSIRGGAYTMTSQAVRFILQFGSTVILARLLTPQDYGLVAMVTAITGFAGMFKDMGLTMATVQREEINHAQVSTLFWINVAFSLAIALLVALVAPIISRFYGEPRLVPITLALAGTFVLSGLMVQHMAILNRQMRFSILAAIDIISLVASIVTGIVMALNKAGYWALIGSTIAFAATGMVLAWVLCGWRPGLPVRGVGVRSLVVFGGNLTVFNMLNYFARNLDNILIGRYWGAVPLALYSRAYDLLMLPLQQVNGPVSSVAIPALSRLQNQPEKYERFYLKTVKVIAYVTMPLVGIMAVLSKEIIPLLLGQQWVGVSPIFMVLAIAALFQSVGNTTGWVYISLNRTKRMVAWGFIGAPLTCLSFVIGLKWGPIGVAASYTILWYSLFYILFAFCYRTTPIALKNFYFMLLRPAAFNISIIAVMIATRFLLRDLAPGWIISGCLAVWALASLGAVLLCRPVREDLSDIVETVFDAFKRV
jgi:O-antigen/teichoic acid export membrane protein